MPDDDHPSDPDPVSDDGNRPRQCHNAELRRPSPHQEVGIERSHHQARKEVVKSRTAIRDDEGSGRNPDKIPFDLCRDPQEQHHGATGQRGEGTQDWNQHVPKGKGEKEGGARHQKGPKSSPSKDHKAPTDQQEKQYRLMEHLDVRHCGGEPEQGEGRQHGQDPGIPAHPLQKLPPIPPHHPPDEPRHEPSMGPSVAGPCSGKTRQGGPEEDKGEQEYQGHRYAGLRGVCAVGLGGLGHG